MKITKTKLKQIIREELNERIGSDPQHAEQMAERATKEQEAEEIRNVLGSGYEVNVRMLEGRYQLTVNKAYVGGEEY
jgi:hypothetical protein